MLSDRLDQQLTTLLRAARPLPPPGWRDQALAALADIRPRRHPNLLTYIIVAALILLLAAGVFAAVRYFYVEGTLKFHDVSVGPDDEWRELGSARFFSGELEWEIGDQDPRDTGDISPVCDKVVFMDGDGTYWDIVKANLDGSDEVNLTDIEGIGGVNCHPGWSPDGSMIAFSHADPLEGLMPCEAGFHMWVMNADGSDAHRVTPQGTPHTMFETWSPDGSRLFAYGYWSAPPQEGMNLAISTDIWGTDVHVLPNVGEGAICSPDGSMIASIWREEGEVDGKPGRWNQLRLTDADGSSPRTLVQQFITYSEVEAYYPTDEMLQSKPHLDWIGAVISHAGPLWIAWSPTGEQLAFLAALPFDPDGPFYMNQIDVWVYDLTTDELIRVTDDDVGQTSLSWK